MGRWWSVAVPVPVRWVVFWWSRAADTAIRAGLAGRGRTVGHSLFSPLLPLPCCADMELIVLLDGIDETTSRCLQARWPPAACHVNVEGRCCWGVKPNVPACLPADRGQPHQTCLCPCFLASRADALCRPPSALQARHSYVPSDIRWHHRFDSCLQRRWAWSRATSCPCYQLPISLRLWHSACPVQHVETCHCHSCPSSPQHRARPPAHPHRPACCRRSGKLGVDFSRFDSTAPRSASSASLHVLHAMASAQSIQSVPSGGARGSFGAAAAAAVQQHLQQQQYRAASMGTGAAAPSSFAGGLAGPYAGSLGSMPAPAPASTLGPTAHSTAPGPVLAAPRDARTG